MPQHGFALGARRRDLLFPLGLLLLRLAAPLGSVERPAHLSLLLLVGIEPPKLAAGHRLGEGGVGADAARAPAKGPTARPKRLDVLQGAPPMPGLNCGK